MHKYRKGRKTDRKGKFTWILTYKTIILQNNNKNAWAFESAVLFLEISIGCTYAPRPTPIPCLFSVPTSMPGGWQLWSPGSPASCLLWLAVAGGRHWQDPGGQEERAVEVCFLCSLCPLMLCFWKCAALSGGSKAPFFLFRPGSANSFLLLSVPGCLSIHWYSFFFF